MQKQTLLVPDIFAMDPLICEIEVTWGIKKRNA